MEMPAPVDGHERMHAFSGSWTGDETIHPTPFKEGGGTASGAMTCEMAVAGFFLLMDYRQSEGADVKYEGHGVIGFEPTSGEHHMWWFDNMGHNPGAPSTGVWNGNTIAFVSQGPRGFGRYTYTFGDDDTLGFTLEMSEDGEQWMLYLEGTYRRAG